MDVDFETLKARFPDQLPYTAEEFKAGFEAWLLTTYGFDVTQWGSSAQFEVLQAEYLQYVLSRGALASLQSGSQLLNFAETVQYAVYTWWYQTGQPSLVDAADQFVSWYS